MKQSAWILCIIFFAASIVDGMDKQPSFSYHPKKGDVLRYKTSLNTEVNVSQMGQDFSVTTANTAIIHNDIGNVTKQNFTYVASFEDYNTSISGAAAMGLADTSMQIGEVIGKHVRHITTFQGHTDSSFVVDSVHIIDPVHQRLAQGYQSLRQIFMELPDNEVKPGDAWTTTNKDSEQTDGGTIVTEVKANYTYVRDADTLGHHCAVIGYTSATTVSGKMKVQKTFDASITGDGTGKGATFFDGAAGMMVANNSTNEMNQQIEINAQQHMVISQTTTANKQTVLLK